MVDTVVSFVISRKDAEQRQVDNDMIRQWVSDIREIAYDTEDVLDKFILQVHDEETSNLIKVHEGGTSKQRKGLFTFIKNCSCICDYKDSLYNIGKEEVNLYGIGKEIEVLRNRLNDVSRRRQLFGLENNNIMSEGESKSRGKLRKLRRTTSFEHSEVSVVGYEDDTRKLLVKLLDNESQHHIISIFGTGGLGKTTLARKLYHNNDVTNKFSHRAWVSVSQDYIIRDLLIRIIKSYNIGDTKDLEKMSEEDLERYLYRSLQGYSYMVVINDVWDKEVWKSLKRAFPNHKNSSRVIITTRNKDIAEHSYENTFAHALRFLNADESWQLFTMKAFDN